MTKVREILINAILRFNYDVGTEVVLLRMNI